MPDVGLALVSIYILYVLRGRLLRMVQAVILLMGLSRQTAVWVYTLLFLPGIIIHELTHFLLAALLGVRTGDITLFPKVITGTEDRITLGSVKVGRSDFIRESLIGAAPFIIGCTVIYALVEIFIKPLLNHSLSPAPWYVWVILYLIITIGNTMFVSKEDTHSWPAIVILLGLFVGVLTLTGWIGRVGTISLEYLIPVSQALALSFGVVIGIDLILICILTAWRVILEKITRRRVVYSANKV